MTQAPPTMIVYKYRLPIPDGPPGALGRVLLTAGATILGIDSQPGPVVMGVAPHPEFFLWAIVCKTVQAKEQRFYAALPTGQEFSAKTLADLCLIGAASGKSTALARSETVLSLGGRFVLHFLLSHPGPVDTNADLISNDG